MFVPEKLYNCVFGLTQKKHAGRSLLHVGKKRKMVAK